VTVTRIGSKLPVVARGAVVGAVVLSPWLFGSAEPWAYLFICILVGVAVAAWLLALISDPPTRLRAPWLTLTLVALLAFLLFQMLPLPSGLVKVVSPLSADAQLTRTRLFEEIDAGEFLPSDLKDNPRWATISASAAATRRSFYLLAAYIGVFVVMANTFTEWAQLRKAATVIVASSFVMAVLGTIHKLSGSTAIFWFHTPRFGGAIFGPFTNPNHYAGYMNMAFGVASGLLLAANSTLRLQKIEKWREKLAWLSTAEASRLTLLAFAAAIMGASVFVSLSRGGITSLAAALGIVGAFVALRGAGHRLGRTAAAVALLVLAAVIWLGWRPVVKELGTLAKIDPVSNSRAEATLATLRMFGASPLFGSGFGSFQHVFPKFQSPGIQFGRWLAPHNDYAQLLAEGGIVGGLLAVLAGVLFVRTVWSRFPKAKRRTELSTPSGDGSGPGATGRGETTGKAPSASRRQFFVIGVAVGLVAIALHSLVDYSLHKPANALLLATLCGMCIAAVHARTERKKRDPRRRRNHDPKKTAKKPAGPVVVQAP